MAGPAGSAGGRAGDVRAGGAFYELNGRDKLSAVLDAAQKRVERFSALMKRAGTFALGGGAALGAGPLGLLLGGTSRLAQIDVLARQMKVPADMLSRVAFAADMAGVSVEEVLADVRRFAPEIAAAPRASAADIKAAAEANREWKSAIQNLQLAMTPLLQTIVPLLQQFGQFARDNAELVKHAGAAAVALVGLGAGLKGIGLAAEVAIPALRLLFSPAGLLVGGIALAVAAFPELAAAGEKAWGAIKEGASDFADWFGDVLTDLRGEVDSLWESISGTEKRGAMAGAAEAMKRVGREMRDAGAGLGSAISGLSGARGGTGFGSALGGLARLRPAAAPAAPVADVLKDAVQSANETKGSFFAGAAAQQFGAGNSVLGRQLETLKQIEKKAVEQTGFLKQVVDAIKVH